MLRALAFAALVFPAILLAQFGSGLGGRRIQGQVRLDGRTAPQGVLLFLDRARGRDTSFVNGSGELGNTMTDSRGRFSFEGIDAGQEHPEGKLYIITARYPGYHSTTQIVDLTASPIGFANLELRKDTSGDTPNVPAEGPGATISARQPATAKAQQELAKAQELLIEKQDPKSSITRFKKVLELEPDYEPGYVLLATAYLQMQDWPDAKSAFNKATRLQPGDSNAFLGLGLVMNEEKDFSGALKPLQKSLELKPDSAEAQYEIGKSFWALGKWADAEPHARKALEINKSFAEAHILMGNVFLRERNANSAMAEFREYLKLAPGGRYAASVKEMVSKIEKAVSER